MEITETEEDIEKIAYRYRKMGYGYISKVYSKEVEKNYYRQAAKIVSTKYNQFITEQEMYEIISNRGKIFTMVVKGNRRAFLETQTGNIGISHFLDRMTELLLHELIHKVGYERNNKSFLYMSVIFKEAGTELIKSRALSDYTTKRFILKDLWASYPEKLDDSFLISSLVNQLNEAVGGQTLEKSILQGDDFFKPSIIEKYGEGSFIFLKENMEDLSREEMRYWTNFIDFPPEEQTEKNKKFKTQTELEDKIRKKVFLIQNAILELEFNRRFKNINSLNEAEDFLNQLNEYGMNRIKIAQKDSEGKIKFIDSDFQDYFNNYKKELEKKYGQIAIEYDENKWQETYKKRKLVPEISDEEKEEIKELSVFFRNKYRRPNIISRISNFLFPKNKKIDASKTNLLEDLNNESIRNPVIVNGPSSKNNDENGYSNESIGNKKNMDKLNNGIDEFREL